MNLILDRVAACTGARSARYQERLRSLWSGYGELFRVELEGAQARSAIVKRVTPKGGRTHPRGWNTDRGHQRKLRSYEVEMAWYQSWRDRCDASCRTPACFGAFATEEGWLFVLEDLDASGFTGRRLDLSPLDIERCLSWLAAFHARFVGLRPEGLWPIGTYWHLQTRPDELQAIQNVALKRAAPKLDALLNNCVYQTFVHGDAKAENFCFSPSDVAAVDFQYVGGGCGVKDVAYFLSSCLDEDECEARAEPLLDLYFRGLRAELSAQRPEIDASALEREWRRMYPVAWADFFRFLAGWSPEHWKIHRYSQNMTDRALALI